MFALNFQTHTAFNGNGTAGPYRLNDNLIFIQTDSVYINDSLLDSSSYTIDYNQGTILFNNALSESIKVIVRYRKVPFTIQEKYFYHTLQTITQNESIVKNSQSLTLNPQSLIFSSNVDASDLELSGSKTISIDVGNKQGTGLEQATRIDIKGNLQGVEISAQLSDVGNPIPPEGTTKELAEFDKILISLKTDKYQGWYGDNDLVVQQGNLGTINKKVIGVLFERNAESGWRKANLGYAKSKGKYKKVQFYGKDNKQGPYYLTQNLKNSAIVPGTENVFLLGKRMIRGQNQDYTIDYSQSSITFTNRQIINSFSRIEIDFEYTSEDYNRYLWNAGSQFQIANGLSVNSGVFSESDDKAQNLVYSLSNSDIEHLQSVSPDSNYIWLSGIKYVGLNNGDYIKQGDTFVYAGLDSGDYDVRFSYIGQGMGNYDYNNPRNKFYYAGENQGKYIVGVRIQLPEQNRIYSANVKYELPIGINFDVDGFLSQRSNNLFAQSIQNKNGLSYLFNSGYNKDRFKINYRRTEFGTDFYFPGTYKTIDFNYQWAGMKQESLKNSDEIETQIKPINSLIFNGGSGWIKTFDNKSRQKYFASGQISPTENYNLVSFNVEHYPDLLNRYSINLTPQYKILYPGIELFWEKATNSKQRYISPSLQIKTSQVLNIKLSSDIKELVEQNKKLINIYKIETDFAKNNINLTGLIGYQTNQINDIQDSENFFSNLSTQISIIQGLSASVDYLEQQGETQTTEINYVWVGVGLGNYNQNPETQEYYFDPQGDYVQELISSGNFIASRTRNVQANWNLYRWQLVNFDGFVSFNNQLTTQQELQAINSRQFNFSILPFDKNLSIRLVNTYDYSRDNLYNISASQRKNDNYRAEINSQKIDNIPVTASLELNHQIAERINVGIEQERKEQIYTLSPVFGFGINIKSDISYNRSLISKPLFYPDLGSFYLHKWKLALERNWEINKLTNLNSRASITRIFSTIAQLPYDINLIEPIGITPELKITLDRIIQSDISSTFKQLILGANYSLLKYPDRPAEHNFSMKLQANF